MSEKPLTAREMDEIFEDATKSEGGLINTTGSSSSWWKTLLIICSVLSFICAITHAVSAVYTEDPAETVDATDHTRPMRPARPVAPVVDALESEKTVVSTRNRRRNDQIVSNNENINQMPANMNEMNSKEKIDHCGECYGDIDSNDKKKMIFNVGFNKAGTTSIHQFFKKNGYNSLHYYHGNRAPIRDLMMYNYDYDRYRCKESADKIFHTYHPDWRASDCTIDLLEEEGSLSNKRPILYDLCKTKDEKNGNKSIQVNTFFDFENSVRPHLPDDDTPILHHGDITWYKLLDEQYPTCSIFLLNIRPIEHWIQSRADFLDGKFVETSKLPSRRAWFDPKYGQDVKLTTEEVLDYWRLDYFDYICDLLRYFDQHENADRKKDLVIFDIESDDPQKLSDYFANYGYTLDTKFWGKSLANKQHSFEANSEPVALNEIKQRCGFNKPQYKWIDER